MGTNERRPIKVVIASGYSGDNSGDNKPELNSTRLFVRVPKSMNMSEIKEVFGEYGDIEHVTLVRNKADGEPRGLAYVNYKTFLAAAKAVEGVDATYRAVFAEPRAPREAGGGKDQPQQQRGGGGYSLSIGGMGNNSSMRGGMGGYGNEGNNSMGGGFSGDMGSSMGNQMQQQQAAMGGGGGFNNATMMNMMQSFMGGNNTPTNMGGGPCKLKVLFNPSVAKDMFWALFNIIPGLVSCDLVEMMGEDALGSVVYNNPQSAAYAMEKINGFEYPTGSRLTIQLDESSMRQGASNHAGMADNVPANVQTLISTIQQATQALQSSGYGNTVEGVFGGGGNMAASRGGFINNSGGGGGGVDAASVCSVHLPPSQPTLPLNTKTEERLFFLFRDPIDVQTSAAVITDAFCRFGNLIEAACIRGKRCGYARYGSRRSAGQALSLLNGAELMGSRLKVEVADEERRTKRARMD